MDGRADPELEVKEKGMYRGRRERGRDAKGVRGGAESWRERMGASRKGEWWKGVNGTNIK